VNGVATFSNLSLNDVGRRLRPASPVVISNSLTLTSTTSLFTVSPAAGTPYSQQITAPLSSTDGAGHSLGYTVQVGGYSQLFVTEQQLALTAPSGTANYYYNIRGDQEKYLISTNGSNAVGGNYYLIVPNGNLYAWLNSLGRYPRCTAGGSTRRRGVR